MPNTKTGKECEICGVVVVGAKNLRRHRGRHVQSELKSQKRESERKNLVQKREVTKSVEFQYNPEGGNPGVWCAHEVEELLKGEEVTVGFGEVSDSDEAEVARVQVREEPREEFGVRLKRFKSDMKGTRLGELLREEEGRSENVKEMRVEESDGGEGTSTETVEEKKRRRGKEPVKKKRRLTEEKKQEAEEMLEWVRRMVAERGDMVSVDDLCEEASAMRIGMSMRETVVETRTEVREIVKPICIIVKRGGFHPEEGNEQEEMSEEDEYVWAGREEGEREYREAREREQREYEYEEARRRGEMMEVISSGEEEGETSGVGRSGGEVHNEEEEDDDFIIISE